MNMISQAETEVRAEAVEANRPPRTRRHLPLKPLLAVILLLIFSLTGYEVWRTNRPSSTIEVAHDLQVAVDLAHEAIEDAKSASGGLPERLPSASLISVVQYEHDRTGYRLTAEHLGTRVTLKSNGEKKVEFNKGIDQ
ncbi:MAG: hypothetical protein H6974_01640 [Gammaproteobacteria bacterium]|nr:hypothetical protein [Gammaproteobacteria bacterium]MCP5195489.1 hypothetical protein [Gammaproteobacteria bacterium]